MMRRDIDYQQQFNQQLIDDKKQMQEEIDAVSSQLTSSKHQCDLLQRQVNGLLEDNERISGMFKMLQSAQSTLSANGKPAPQPVMQSKDSSPNKEQDNVSFGTTSP